MAKPVWTKAHEAQGLLSNTKTFIFSPAPGHEKGKVNGCSHHVRGATAFYQPTLPANNYLPAEFFVGLHYEEDFGAACKKWGLEDEFVSFLSCNIPSSGRDHPSLSCNIPSSGEYQSSARHRDFYIQ